MFKTATMAAVIMFLYVFLQTGPAFCQTASRADDIKHEKLVSLGPTERTAAKWGRAIAFDYGGWFNYRFDDYNDYDNDSSEPDDVDNESTWDLRLWAKAVLKPPPDAGYENEHSLYIRLKNEYSFSEALGIAQGWDHEGPDVDYAYLVLDLRPLWVGVGRRYFNVGNGIAYSDVGDGVELTLATQEHMLTGLLSRNLKNQENIDMSIPGYAQGSERYFFASQYTYRGIKGHDIYGYFVMERDKSDEKPGDPVHDFNYDSEYVGIGAQGDILPNLHYWSEIIRETGRSRVYPSNNKKNISAWGGVFGSSYNFDFYSRPTILFQYAFGSGDPDRVSVTDTEDGNRFGKDKNFLYFGYLDTGYALSPLLSNLHIYKISASLNPIEAIRPFKDFKVTVGYHWYFKDVSAGGIYDPQASNASHGVGSEVDIELFWQILSDLNCTVQYGHFIPGNAYPSSNDDSEDRFSISTIVTF